MNTIEIRRAVNRDVHVALRTEKSDHIGRRHHHHAPVAGVLDRVIGGGHADGAMVSKSRAIRRVLSEVHLVAPTNTTVLLVGETGVGKEVFARAIHDASPRRDRPMIRVNPSAIPATLVESELFGHERGAFTDAVARRTGRFEAANGSTLFLDEIGELPTDLQAKLLRVLEARTIERVGSCESIKVDIRIIAATNRNLEDAVANDQFREDLFYRLNVFPIMIPPLRERREDIPDLAWRFIDELSRKFGKTIESIAPESLRELQNYPWPGNIRELRNVIERAMIVAKSSTLAPVVPCAR
jgi:formate hydrogenlyase transcriptional activator